MLTDSDLQQIMPRLPQAKRQLYLPFINKVMEIYEIDTPLRASAFLAQIAHESAELRFMEEIWGPTAQQKKYEPPSSVAKALGKGHWPRQLQEVWRPARRRSDRQSRSGSDAAIRLLHGGRLLEVERLE
jgi:predicted chitinase